MWTFLIVLVVSAAITRLAYYDYSSKLPENNCMHDYGLQDTQMPMLSNGEVKSVKHFYICKKCGKFSEKVIDAH